MVLHFVLGAVVVEIDWRVPANPQVEWGRIELLPAEREAPLYLPPKPKVVVPEVAPVKESGPRPVPSAPEAKPEAPVVIADSPKPKSTRQFIWRPEERKSVERDIEAPNVVAVNDNPVNLALLNQPAYAKAKAPFAAPKETPPRERQLVQFQEPIPSGQTGPPGNVQIAIVGLNPADRFAGPPPEGSREAQFAQAPNQGPASSGRVTDPTAARVPGLAAKGNSAPAAPVTIPATTPEAVPERRILKETRYAGFNRTLSMPLRPSSRQVPASVEAQFSNRNLYALVLPAPEMPDYDGDWVLWFAETRATGAPAGRMLAPVPARKYSLNGGFKGSPAAAAGTVQLAATIDPSGRVSGVKILRSRSGPEIGRKAAEDLGSWEFQPAMRDGSAIAVDLVVEISYRAGPAVR